MVMVVGNPWLPPLPAFPHPVVAPETDPDEGEQVTVCFGRAWLPYVLGAAASLILPTTWQGDDAAVLLAQYRAALLLAMIGNPDEDCSLMDCTDVLACIFPAGRLQRMNATTGRYEYSDDAGETWQDGSNQDPRFNAPRNSMTAFDCDDARAIGGFIQAMTTELTDQLDLGAAATSITGGIGAILATVFGFTPVGAIVTAGIGAIIALGSAAIQAALDGNVWDRLICNLYETLEGVTTVTADLFDDILARIVAEESATAEAVLWYYVNQLGPVGLQNAIAAQLEPSGVAAGCCPTWCFEWDFTVDNGGWETELQAPQNTNPRATYVGGSGWKDTAPGGYAGTGHVCAIKKNGLTPATVTRIEVDYSVANFSPRNESFFSPFVPYAQNNLITVANGSGTASFDGTWSAGTQISLSLFSTATTFDCTIVRIRLFGPGATNPYGEDNC